MTTEGDRPETESVESTMSAEINEAAESSTPLSRLIGSQRNPDAYRPQPTVPVVAETAGLKTETYPPDGVEIEKLSVRQPPPEENVEDEEMPDHLSEEGEKSLRDVPVRGMHRVQIPKFRDGKLPDDLEDEFNAVFSGESLETLIDRSAAVADREVLEPDTKLNAKVLSIQGDSVFLDIGAREQGVVSLKMFPPDAEPVAGQTIEVTVPLAAADVRDWSQVQEGMIVEAKITKTNSGGLECEVNRLRGFIPISQIDLFRVEDTEQYVGQKLTCVVEEVNVERRNLVLSRRAMLNRERDEMKTKLLAELEIGQTREGLVRKIIDAGAFVDLGGVDGFIPISKMSWGRINHPGDVLSEGTRVKVRIDRIEEGTNRISLVYRDDASNPWSNISERFQEKTVARGKITKIMEFGAFVELMPGLEGLIHISELSHKRVGNVREVVKEGEWADVYIVSIDPDSRRIGLSIKQLAAAPEPEPNETGEESATDAEGAPTGKGKKKEEGVAAPIKVKQAQKGPLKGGMGQSSGGEQFGLKW